MLSLLGIDKRPILTGAFMLGAAVAALGGAVIVPKGAATHGMDLNVAEVFVVVVVSGLGSITGAALAALLVATVRTLPSSAPIFQSPGSMSGKSSWWPSLSFWPVFSPCVPMGSWGDLRQKATVLRIRQRLPVRRWTLAAG